MVWLLAGFFLNEVAQLNPHVFGELALLVCGQVNGFRAILSALLSHHFGEHRLHIAPS